MGWWVYLDYSATSGPFLSYEIEIGEGPGPELDNYIQKVTLTHCVWSVVKLDRKS